MWDVPLAEVGPTGEDKGDGGKYVLLAPDYKGGVPVGYYPIRMETYDGFWLMRTIPKSNSPSDIEDAISLLKKISMYPLSKANAPPTQRFIDAYGKLWNGIPRMDEGFYAILARMVNEEPVIAHDLAMMDILRSIGIEKGKEFKPDAARTAILKSAIQEAKAWLINEQRSQSDAWAPPKKAGEATYYITAFSDHNDRPLTGDKTYRLHVPDDVPAKQYWSVTVYGADTAGFVREAPVISLDSYNEKTKKNSDGSIDVYFGPHPPTGQENNWVATPEGGRWFASFRLYGPEKRLFERTWKLPDLEQIANR
jgi:hypothetical protein